MNAAWRIRGQRRSLARAVAAAITLLFNRPEPIEVIEQGYNFLPLRFRWSGELCRVRQVKRVWDEAATALLPPRRYFWVICDDGGERMVFQDLRLGMWYVRG